MTIIDTPTSAADAAACLRAQGVTTVMRYYNFQNSAGLPSKRLEPEEAERLCGAGLRLGVVFQQRQNRADDFSERSGARAAERALTLARDIIGQPAGSAIYFAVDFDADDDAVRDRLTPYFRAVARAFDDLDAAERFAVGVYGSGLVARRLREAELVSHVWLSMSRGFRDTREELAAGRYHLAQRAPASSLCGLGVDFNDVNPDPAWSGFGDFTVEAAAGGTPAPTAAADARVAVRAGARVRAGPGTNFDTVKVLPYGTRLRRVAVRDGWASVDLEGDGAIDGFIFDRLLEDVASVGTS